MLEKGMWLQKVGTNYKHHEIAPPVSVKAYNVSYFIVHRSLSVRNLEKWLN